MRFVGQHHQACVAAQALDRGEHALALHWEGAGVVVLFAMDQQQRVLDLVRVVERRHRTVDLGCLPEIAFLGLETERGERAVVGATAGDAGLEQARVRQQVGSHEGAVGMATHGDALAVRHATTHHFVHRRFRAGHQLRHIGVVGFLVAFADDGHREVIQHGIAHRQVRVRAPVADRIEAIRRVGDLAGGIGGFEFSRVGPHQHRQRAVTLCVVTGRQVQGGIQVHAVLALVTDLFLADVFQLRRGMREAGQGTRCRLRIAQLAHEEIRRLLR